MTLIYFLAWGALMLLMMRFGCGAHVMGHHHGHRHDAKKRVAAAPADETHWAPPATDIDPVCGMVVETAAAKSSIYAGRAYHFCSAGCREEFEAAPDLHVSKGARAPEDREYADEC